MTSRAALLLGMTVAAFAGCSDDGAGEPEPLADFVVTAPDGFAELVPTTTVDVTWRVTADPGLALQLEVVTGSEPPIMIERRDLAPGTSTWDGRDPARLSAPPGNYRVRAVALGPDDGEVDTFLGVNAHLIVVQGVRFRDRTLRFTGGQVARELVLTTVARSPMELELVVDPDVATSGDELPLLVATIPGELVPMSRSYPFTGRTADDRALAAGSYVVAAVIRASAGAITYRVDGPTLAWTP